VLEARDLALKSIRLTKLHGSIDWLQGTDSGDEDVVVRTGVPEHRGGPLDGRILLYPGFKGMPEVEPFRTLHESFTGAVRHAGHALFIGFAFRDEAISHVLKTWMSPECRVMVVAGKNFDKSRLPACEAMAKAEVVPAYFQEKEAETAISNFFGSLR
jgi:hypothetical protein